MGLTYRYAFRASATRTATELAAFLHRVEIEAQRMKFWPTAVINVSFDTAERAEFSRRLGCGFWVRDERLKHSIPVGAIRYLPEDGECSISPLSGVVLVITDETEREACFGFMQFPERVLARDGTLLAGTGLNGEWVFEEVLQSPDPRYREIVQLFNAADYVERVTDDFII